MDPSLMRIHHQGHGFLYEIKDNENHRKGFILGSIPLTDETSQPIDTLSIESLKKSKNLFLEYTPSQEDIQTLLSNSDYLQCGQTTQLFVQKFKLLPGIDSLLTTKAKEWNLPVTALETLQETLSYIKILGKLKKRQYDALTRNDSQEIKKMEQEFDTFLTAYKKGCGKDLKNIIEKGTDFTESEKKELFYDRAVKLANKIDSHLHHANAPFFIVGIRQLLEKKSGKNDLISLLRKKGWRLEKAKLDETEKDLIAIKKGLCKAKDKAATFLIKTALRAWEIISNHCVDLMRDDPDDSLENQST